MTASRRAAIYTRISQDQSGHQTGVSRQATACRKLVKDQGLAGVAEFSDNDISAYSGKRRPGFEALLESVEARQVEVVVVWSIDRLYRRMTELTRLTEVAQRTGVRVLAVVDSELDLSTAGGVLQAQVAGAVAQHESARKAERIKARIEQRVAAGVMASGGVRPTGWRWCSPCPGGSECQHPTACEIGQTARARVGSRAGLELDPFEAPLLARAYAELDAGASINAVTKMLGEAGLRGPVTGGPLKAPTLRSTIALPRHAGLVALRGQIVGEATDGQRLVDPNTWRRVQTRLSDPCRRNPGGGRSLLSGLLVCGQCESPWQATTKQSRNSNERTPVYKCRGCGMTRRRSAIEPNVEALALAWLEQNAGAVEAARPASAGTSQAALEVDTLTQRLQDLAALAAEGVLAPADFAAAAAKVREQLTVATASATREAGKPATAALGTNPVAAYSALPVDRRRTVLREVFESVTISRPAITGHPKSEDVAVAWRD